ncbi:ABC transporter ATP-binding protein/permease [Acetatifactor muris]|uniref:Lipid A export ATP-binding/permease protein MsbA n=1 Tax=Acetatifactor muris TaxID=879566 RepID=A0A2K4ZFX3_9FIRM|nr:ABC transporter ATP-binding protein [Acetatifactor muris]MCR2047635.1 ABC transporter ATP-binding protein/permease [Acetatifactor muris]SOY29359.1 Lipid A export ATP-binding/permease protein MsbA [Acetatifactor muris]
MHGNFHYTISHLRQKEGNRAVAVCVTDIGLSVLLPFLEAALAGAVAACLVSGRRPEEILLLVAAYVLLLQMVRFLQSHFSSLRREKLFMFRLDMAEEFYRKTLTMDGQSRESAEGQKKWEAAQRNLYSGNDAGIEAYAKGFCELFLHLGGLVLYGVTVGRASLLMLLLLTVQTLITSAFHMQAGRRVYQMDGEVEREWKRFHYLRRVSVDAGKGKDIRLYRMDVWFLRAFRECIGKICAILDRGRSGFTVAGIVQSLLSFGGNIILYGWLLWQMAAGNLTLPGFLLYVGIAAGFESWMRGVFEAVQEIAQNEKLMDGYRDFMDFGIEQGEREAPTHPGSIHEIRLENVCFRYEGNGKDTIHDLNLRLRPGEKLALVGLNGAGKTTLVKLLCGLYRPTAGKIYLDGQDMSSLSREKLFREFAVVFQDVSVFSFPLGENVTCEREGQEDSGKLRESLEKSGLLERVRELPEGLNTVMNRDLDPKGVTLSGGELQKLMLARALYKDAPIVILDEPTAALDPIAESEMYEKYDEMIQGKTTVFISHRLSSTRFCDRILFLEEGHIIQEGSHESLMKANGAYAELFALQARYYRNDADSEMNCHAVSESI